MTDCIKTSRRNGRTSPVEGRIVSLLLHYISEHCQIFKITYLEEQNKFPGPLFHLLRLERFFIRHRATFNLSFLLLLTHISNGTVRQVLEMCSIVTLLSRLVTQFCMQLMTESAGSCPSSNGSVQHKHKF